MKICLLAAGAAGMYCGSCMRDNALAAALMRGGHQVTLIPLYTPLRTDVQDVSIGRIFYGGINVYLQFATRLFRHTPRAIDWMLDRRWLLKLSSRMGDYTSAQNLGALTVSVLRGEDGEARKELDRLVQFIATEARPQVISLPNAMFIGMAKLLRQQGGAPVVCELTGEDIFLQALIEPYRAQSLELIRARVGDVSRFVATSEYYANRVVQYLGIPRQKIAVVYPGISREHFANPQRDASPRPPTVGYFARICPEKGLDRLVEPMRLLRQQAGMSEARLRYAGYLGRGHRAWHEQVRGRFAQAGVPAEYVGEVDLSGKLAFFDSIDILSVPTSYPESKGIYVLEALARGVSVVQSDCGAFPELLRLTGGGVMFRQDDFPAHATAMGDLLRGPSRRASLGQAGRQAVQQAFTDDHMAARMVEVYRDVSA